MPTNACIYINDAIKAMYTRKVSPFEKLVLILDMGDEDKERGEGRYIDTPEVLLSKLEIYN